MLTMSMSNPFVTSDNGYMHWPNQRRQVRSSLSSSLSLFYHVICIIYHIYHLCICMYVNCSGERCANVFFFTVLIPSMVSMNGWEYVNGYDCLSKRHRQVQVQVLLLLLLLLEVVQQLVGLPAI
jgi:hypothetical protein